MRGSLLGRWDVGMSAVRESGCGRDGGEAELLDFEDGKV